MIFPTLAGRNRRAVKLGALVLLPAVFGVLVVAPYLRAVGRATETLQIERDLLARETDLLQTADRYPAAFEQGATRLVDAAPRLFGGDSPAMASANVAQYLQEASRLNEVLITQLETMSPEDAGTGVITLPLLLKGQTDLEGLLSMLHALESGPKLVRVDNLRVRGGQGQVRGSVPDPQVLSFEFTASGFMLVLPEASATSEPTQENAP